MTGRRGDSLLRKVRRCRLQLPSTQGFTRFYSPHLCVGFLFLVLYPTAFFSSSSSSSRCLPSSHIQLVITQLTHNSTHTQLAHIQLNSHNLLTHNSTHTQLAHISHIQLVIIQLAHTQLSSHTTCSHATQLTQLVITQLTHTNSTHTQLALLIH